MADGRRRSDDIHNETGARHEWDRDSRGSYTLFLQPEENGSAKLIVNKQTGQWGTKYDAAQDLARIELKKEATEKPVDQFTIEIEKSGESGGTLNLMWENTQYSAPFTVKK